MRNCKYMTFRLNQGCFLVMAQDFDTRTTETFWIDCGHGQIQMHRGDIDISTLEQYYPFKFRLLHPWVRAWIRSVMEAAPGERWASAVGMSNIPPHVTRNPVIRTAVRSWQSANN